MIEAFINFMIAWLFILIVWAIILFITLGIIAFMSWYIYKIYQFLKARVKEEKEK